MDDHSNIVLTGFMGTGKSTVGRMLAEATGRTFVDTDAVIEERHGPIHAIFAAGGEAAFRELERQTASDVGARSNLVVATGGRMMLDPRNVGAFHGARVFTLTADAAEIHRRIVADDGPRRPLLEVDDPLGRIEELLAERKPGYEVFPRIQSGGRTPEAVAGEITELVERGTVALTRDSATVYLGVGEIMRWRTRLRAHGSPTLKMAVQSARRLAPVFGSEDELGGADDPVVIGGSPPESFALYVPTEITRLIWWATHPAAAGVSIFDVGILQDDVAGMAMLDQYRSQVAELDVPPWPRRAGAHPRLLAWLLDVVEAVCREAGFERSE